MDNIYLVAKHVAQCEYIEPETGAKADDSTEIIEAFDDKAVARAACQLCNEQAQKDPWTYDDPDKSDPRYWELITLPIKRLSDRKPLVKPRWCSRKLEEAYDHIKPYLKDTKSTQPLRAMCQNCSKYNGKDHDFTACRNEPCFMFYLAYEYLEWSGSYGD